MERGYGMRFEGVEGERERERGRDVRQLEKSRGEFWEHPGNQLKKWADAATTIPQRKQLLLSHLNPPAFPLPAPSDLLAILHLDLPPPDLSPRLLPADGYLLASKQPRLKKKKKITPRPIEHPDGMDAGKKRRLRSNEAEMCLV